MGKALWEQKAAAFVIEWLIGENWGQCYDSWPILTNFRRKNLVIFKEKSMLRFIFWIS
jgi:hypothetical protein